MRRTVALLRAKERAKAAETLLRMNIVDVPHEHREVVHAVADALREAQLRLARVTYLMQTQPEV